GNDDSGAPRAATQQERPPEQSMSKDQRLFADPYAMLSEIAAETGILQNVSAKGDGGAQTAGPATGASGGPSYRDPFSPDFWSQQEPTPLAEASAERAQVEGEPDQPGDKIATAEIPETRAVVPMPPRLEEAPLEPLADTQPLMTDAADADTDDTDADEGTQEAVKAPA